MHISPSVNPNKCHPVDQLSTMETRPIVFVLFVFLSHSINSYADHHRVIRQLYIHCSQSNERFFLILMDRSRLNNGVVSRVGLAERFVSDEMFFRICFELLWCLGVADLRDYLNMFVWIIKKIIVVHVMINFLSTTTQLILNKFNEIYQRWFAYF